VLSRIANMFRVPDLRKKILFTLFTLALYRLGSFIPSPGIDTLAVQQLRENSSQQGGILAYVQLFSGGGLTTFAIFALGVLPYITASIIMLVMWMGELITQKGIGNGMSLIIFASIVSQFPAQFSALWTNSGVAAVLTFSVILLISLVGIVFVENGQRRIPVNFAKRVVGRKMYGGQSTYIPLKVNQSGVIPIIFASSVLYLPNLIAVALPDTGWGNGIRNFVNDNLVNPSSPLYIVVFGFMIVGFAYFYTAITFDPAKQADTIRKQGGFIPGIRPGPQTEHYLARILTRITLPGALFIAAVALLPNLMMRALGFNLTDTHSGGLGAAGFGFIGISILIAVGVALETMKQIDSQLMMRNYEGFLGKKK